ncbi:class I SAM-dependent methyltransferase [Aestuariispira insulae]|uniref:Methyltransferase family protein n=1 Tax=Aestuariispira insulae TaxID=1461337 RepID=A0A3D9HWW5_9PROT|nr:class I SAM-dependent methyltransferase [Aestuariispira insulae]RED53396.1 methyltransferase family protein [Aestuariispira insulae]
MARFSVKLLSYPILRGFLAQLFALAAVISINIVQGHYSGTGLPIISLLLFNGLIAAAISTFLGLPSWWLYIQVSFPFLIAASQVMALPGWIFPLALLFLIVTFWNSIGDRVPLYLSNRATGRALLKLLPENRPGRFMDLGCGPAGLLIQLAKARPDWHFTGIEASPALWLLARIRVAASGCNNIDIHLKNIWKTDVYNQDFIYCFLSPAPMPALFRQLSQRMHPGSRLVSNSFDVPGQAADEIISLKDHRDTKLHLWQI